MVVTMSVFGLRAMQSKSLLCLLVLTVSPLLAQEEGAGGETPRQEIQKPVAAESKSPDTKADDSKTAESKTPSKAGANFQPSEEIMADTMLTLPADI